MCEHGGFVGVMVFRLARASPTPSVASPSTRAYAQLAPFGSRCDMDMPRRGFAPGAAGGTSGVTAAARGFFGRVHGVAFRLAKTRKFMIRREVVANKKGGQTEPPFLNPYYIISTCFNASQKRRKRMRDMTTPMIARNATTRYVTCGIDDHPDDILDVIHQMLVVQVLQNKLQGVQSDHCYRANHES